MNEIAKPTPHAAFCRVQPTTRLPKIRHRTQFTVNRPGSIPPRIERIARRLCTFLILEPRIHVPDQMVVIVIAYDHLLHLAVLAHLAPEVLVEGVEVVLELRGREAGLVVVCGVLVEVREQDGLRVGGLDVFARAAVAVAAGADLVVEAAVDLVLFRAEDGGEVVGHGGWWRSVARGVR